MTAPRFSLFTLIVAAVLTGLVAACVPASPSPPTTPSTSTSTTVPPTTTTTSTTSTTTTTLVPDPEASMRLGWNVYSAGSAWTCGHNYAEHDQLAELFTTFDVEHLRFSVFSTMRDQGGWDPLDAVLDTAAEHGVSVTPVLAGHWGHCEAEGLRSADWYRAGNHDDYLDWVTEVITRWRDHPAVTSWDLMGEPEVCAPDGAEVLRAFADEVGALAESLDPSRGRTVSVIGGNQCGAVGEQYTSLFASPYLTHCSFHDYHHPNDPLPELLELRLSQCAGLDKELVVGEVGIGDDEITDLSDRAAAFAAKFDAYAAAGVASVHVWMPALPQAHNPPNDPFNVLPDDPSVAELNQRR